MQLASIAAQAWPIQMKASMQALNRNLSTPSIGSLAKVEMLIIKYWIFEVAFSSGVEIDKDVFFILNEN